MPKIILCRGIQGSGKTTWAKQWVLEDPEHRVRFNNDDIRNMLGKYWVPSRELLVRALKIQFIATSIEMGYDIVIDNMNLNPKEIEFYKPYIETQEDNCKIVKSPMVGTFYLKPDPNSNPYVEIGKKVKKGDILCIIEAMKLMNEIECEFDGEIAEILVKDGEMVEYGKPLFKIK